MIDDIKAEFWLHFHITWYHKLTNFGWTVKSPNKRLRKWAFVGFSWAAFLPSFAPTNGRIVYADPILPTPPSISYKPLPLLKAPSYALQEPAERILLIAPQGTYANDYAPFNCTEYVASRVQVPNSMGNASNWDDYARSIGVTVSLVPKVGAVAQTDAYGLGHVAVVEAIGDGTVTVSEANYNGLGVVDTRTTPLTDWVYLYF